MPRRYRRKSYRIARPVKTTKYSNETFATAITAQFLDQQSYQTTFTPGINVMGTRKVKNFTLSVIAGTPVPFYFALVYVPEGTVASALKFGHTITDNVLTSDSLYEPNQNVIMSGIFGGDANQVYRFKSRLARNLNSNDSIQLVVRPVASTEANTVLLATLNYALAF